MSAGDPVVVVVAANLADMNGTVATIGTVRLNTTRPLVFEVLTYGLGDRQRRRLRRAAGPHPVRFHAIGHPRVLVGLGGRDWEWRRILLSSVIEQSRCLYLDSDLLIRGDVGELWDMPMADVLAATPDQHMSTAALRGAAMAERGGDAMYGNFGVLVMDLDRLRTLAVPERTAGAVATWGADLQARDQDVLNLLFHGNIGRLPATWNQLFPFVGRCHDPKVVHFVGDVWPLRARHFLSDMAFRSELLATASAGSGDRRLRALGHLESALSPIRRLRRTMRARRSRPV